MTAALLAFVFLCGVPVGAVAGLLIAWRVFRPERDDSDVDYSGGV